MVESDYSRFTPEQRCVEFLSIFDSAYARHIGDKGAVAQLLPRLMSLMNHSELTVVGKSHIISRLEALQENDRPESYSLKSFGKVLNVVRESITGPFLKESAKSIDLAAFADLERETNVLQLALDYGVIPQADAMEAILNNRTVSALWKKEFKQKYGEELALPKVP